MALAPVSVPGLFFAPTSGVYWRLLETNLCQLAFIKKREGCQMTECDHMLTELEEKILKWRGARECGEKADASHREKADLKMVEEEYLGLQQRVRKYVLAEGSEQEKDRLVRLEHHSTTAKR
jgi:hypothetical protein